MEIGFEQLSQTQRVARLSKVRGSSRGAGTGSTEG